MAKFSSTTLVSDNSTEEIRKADLSLLEKINAVADSISSSTSTITSSSTTTTTTSSSKARLFCKYGYTANGIQLANGEVITFGQKTGSGGTALFNGVPTTESTYSAPFKLQRPAGETGTLVKVDYFHQGGCALYSSGNFYTIGYQPNGQLGLGNTTSRSILTLSTTNVTEYKIPINLNYESNSQRIWIKKTDGLWYVAGYNGNGACGDGTTTNVPLWKHPTSMGTDVKELWNLGGSYGCTLFLTNSNKLYATGYNGSGQFGNNSTATLASFTDITSYWGILPTDTVKFTGEFGYYSTAANGASTIFMMRQKQGQQGYTIYASGNNGDGELGNGTTTNTSTPVQIKNLPENISVFKTAGGSPCSCYALTQDGKLYVWSYNGLGQLGIGNTTNQTSVQLVTIAGEQISDVFADGHAYTYSYVNQAFLQTASGNIYAAGDNGNGQCGDGTATDILTWKNIPFDTYTYGRIVDMAWNGYGDGGFYITALTDKDRFFVCGYNGRQGLSLTGEAINKSIFTELIF